MPLTHHQPTLPQKALRSGCAAFAHHSRTLFAIYFFAYQSRYTLRPCISLLAAAPATCTICVGHHVTFFFEGCGVPLQLAQPTYCTTIANTIILSTAS